MEPLLIPAEQAAAILGLHINTLRGMAKRGLIPPARNVGRKYMFHREALVEWADKVYGYKRKKGA